MHTVMSVKVKAIFFDPYLLDPVHIWLSWFCQIIIVCGHNLCQELWLVCFLKQEYTEREEESSKPEEPVETEKQVENAKENEPLVETEEEPQPKEEEIETPPLISTEDVDLLVS